MSASADLYALAARCGLDARQLVDERGTLGRWAVTHPACYSHLFSGRPVEARAFLLGYWQCLQDRAEREVT